MRILKFLMSAVTRFNDRYLVELRSMLEERCGVKVNDATVWRTLQRVGFRMKEVRPTNFVQSKVSSLII